MIRVIPAGGGREADPRHAGAAAHGEGATQLQEDAGGRRESRGGRVQETGQCSPHRSLDSLLLTALL